MDETPDRWSDIDERFFALVDLAETERDEALVRETAADPARAAELRRLLRHASTAASRLRRAVDSSVALAAGIATPPSRFGGYRVVRELGRGGMGVVYEGLSDDEFQRRVAIKVAPLAGDLVEARFRMERRILAGLDHPFIARFLDGGTEGGQPYFVMEFVDGVPITAHCRDRALRVDARLVLVRQVCAALSYAHQHLVVHRDLKPSNILVTPEGTPKLLDFGIAKLLDHEGAAAPTLGLVAWTPDYASPEQITGAAISTHSDVYSLGLVLYELLSGQPGQTADRSSALALARSVCEQEPPAPSAAAAAHGEHALARELRGDLDAIVQMATRKEPSRRYRSVEELADDLERVAAGLPVRATASTWRYRAGKWVARHRAAAAAAAIAVVGVSAGAGVATYQWQRAERRFAQVRSLANAFVFDVDDRIESLAGATDARRAIVQTAVTYLENLREEAAGDPGLAKELAAAYLKIGDVQGRPQAPNLGEPDAALTSYDRADALLRPMERAGDAAAMVSLAEVALHRAQVLMSRDDGGALEVLDRARALCERAVAAGAGGYVDASRVLGDVLGTLGRHATARGDAVGAVHYGEQAMAVAEQRLRQRPADPDRQDDLATAANVVGVAQLSAGALDDARRSFRRGVELREALVAATPDNINYRRNLMISYGNLADVLATRIGFNLGDVAGAREALSRALALAGKTLAADANDRRAMADVVQIELRLGGLETPPREPAADLGHLEVAGRLIDRLVAAQPADTTFALLRVLVDRRTALSLAALGRSGEAERFHVRARDSARDLQKSPGAGPNARQQWIQSNVSLAQLYAGRGDQKAIGAADEAAAALRERPITPAAAVAPQYAALGRVYLDLMARAPAPVRPALRTSALEFLDKGTAAWREARLAAALEPRRAEALTAIAKDRARIRQ